MRVSSTSWSIWWPVFGHWWEVCICLLIASLDSGWWLIDNSPSHSDQRHHHTIRDIPGLRWEGTKGWVIYCIAVAFGSKSHPERMDMIWVTLPLWIKQVHQYLIRDRCLFCDLLFCRASWGELYVTKFQHLKWEILIFLSPCRSHIKRCIVIIVFSSWVFKHYKRVLWKHLTSPSRIL